MADTNNGSVPQATIDDIKKMTQAKAVATLKSILREAVKLEMATIPIYLYTYYSICRKPGVDQPPTSLPLKKEEYFPHKKSLYGNLAGATIMSVAVEEMLHMSLAMNLLTSMLEEGEDLPQIYNGLTFGNKGGIVLPALDTLTKETKLTKLGRPIETTTSTPLEIPLNKLSLKQLEYFMRIEYPAKKDSVSAVSAPKDLEWATIGEIYDYAKALINHGNGKGGRMPDTVFQGGVGTQIGTENYSASNIDTLSSGKEWFKFNEPPVANKEDPVSAAHVAVFENNDDHDFAGDEALFRIGTAAQAITAIDTICEQGEGADYSQYVDPDKDVPKEEWEESHYYKFWSLCAYLEGYDPKKTEPPYVEGIPAPKPASDEDRVNDLEARFVYNFPKNPKAHYYSVAARGLIDVANGLFQYMLIMSETTLLVPPGHQKLYFNKAMHQSMIWVMDKFYQDLRHIQDRGFQVVPTFENPFPAGTTRETAFAALQELVAVCEAKSSVLENYSKASWNLGHILALPDVSVFWDGDTGVVPAKMPDYLTPPKQADISPVETVKAGKEISKVEVKPQSKHEEQQVTYKGVQKFTNAPPSDTELDAYAGEGNWVRHACMGLNSCKNQGRTLNNNCAGQGWCSTALAYNAADPSQPGISDHTCHVKNNCAGQGGCGLYGTEEELSRPGGNACQTRGSCATPINAERFITDGEKRRESVWKQARAHFESHGWKALEKSDGGKKPLPAPADGNKLFGNGPTIEWIEASDQGMTACGASGMSGAGSCA